MLSLFRSIFSEFEFPKDGDTNFNKTIEESEKDGLRTVKESWRSIDGSQFFQKTSVVSIKGEELSRLENLKSDLKLAIKNEEFEKAATLRDEIKELKKEVK